MGTTGLEQSAILLFCFAGNVEVETGEKRDGRNFDGISLAFRVKAFRALLPSRTGKRGCIQ